MRKAVQAAARRTRIRRNSTGSPSNDDTPPSSPGGSGGAPSDVTSVPASAPPLPGNSSNNHHHPHPTITTLDNIRRKATVEEAALTAKNYRLAKELSELRVRHREETKNVNRLTMENMNLASRCRGAISHVAMLKKELASIQQQQRALQQNQGSDNNTVASSNSSGKASDGSTQNNNNNISANGRKTPIQPSHQSRNNSGSFQNNSIDNGGSPMPLLPPPKSPPRPSTFTDLPNETSRGGTAVVQLKPRTDDLSEDVQMDQLTAPLVSSEQDFSSPSKQQQQNQLDTAVARPEANSQGQDKSEATPGAVVGEDSGDDDEDDDEKDPVSELPNPSPTKSTQLSGLSSQSASSAPFPHSASPKLGRSLHNSNNYNEQFPGDITSVSRLHSRNRVATLDGFEEESDLPPLTMDNDKSTISSIDAFEASFNTNFPESFATVQPSSAVPITATSPEARRATSSSLSHSSYDTYNPFSSSPHDHYSPTHAPGSGSSSSSRKFHNKRAHQRADPPGKSRTSQRTQPQQQTGQVLAGSGLGANSSPQKQSTAAMGAFSPTLVASNNNMSTIPNQNHRAALSLAMASFQNGGTSIHNMNGASSYSSPLKETSPHSLPNYSSTTPSSLVGMTRQQQHYHHLQPQQNNPTTPPASYATTSPFSESSFFPSSNANITAPSIPDQEPRTSDSGSGHRNKNAQQHTDQSDLGLSSAARNNSSAIRLRYDSSEQPEPTTSIARLRYEKEGPSIRSPSNNVNNNDSSTPSPHKSSAVGHNTFSIQPRKYGGDEDYSSSRGEWKLGGVVGTSSTFQPRRAASSTTDGFPMDEQIRTSAANEYRGVDSGSNSLDGTPVRSRADYLIQQQLQKTQQQQQKDSEQPQYAKKTSQVSAESRFSIGGSNNSGIRDSGNREYAMDRNTSSISSGGRSKRESSPFEEKKVDNFPGAPENFITKSRFSPRDFSSKPHHRSQRSLEGRSMDSSHEEKKSDGGSSAPATTAVADSPPVVSVKDRVSLFSSAGSPRSPEGERIRISAVTSSPLRQHQNPPHSSPSYSQSNSVHNMVSSPRPFMVDDGDIPLVSSIRRTSKDSSSTIQNSKSSGSVKKFPPWIGDERGALTSNLAGDAALGNRGSIGGEVSSS